MSSNRSLSDNTLTQNEAKLRRKIATATSAAIAKNGYATAIDALLATGRLRPEKVEEWRRGRVRDCRPSSVRGALR